MDRRELEWQLAAPDLIAVRRWLAEHEAIDGLRIEPRPAITLHDTYFDTDDWRMHRAGFALRVRASSRP
jgi:triphosphatase